MVKAPVNIEMIMVFCICFFNILWISIDPLLLKGILKRYWERILDEISYSFLYTVYAIVVLVWYSIYDEIYEILDAKNIIN